MSELGLLLELNPCPCQKRLAVTQFSKAITLLINFPSFHLSKLDIGNADFPIHLRHSNPAALCCYICIRRIYHAPSRSSQTSTRPFQRTSPTHHKNARLQASCSFYSIQAQKSGLCRFETQPLRSCIAVHQIRLVSGRGLRLQLAANAGDSCYAKPIHSETGRNRPM